MDRKIRLLIVTDQKGQQYKLKNAFENEGFNAVVVDSVDTAQQFILQDCDVVLCKTCIQGIVPAQLIAACQHLEIPIVTMGSNPAYFVVWLTLGVSHVFDSDTLMQSGDVGEKAVKNCSEVLQKLVSKKV